MYRGPAQGCRSQQLTMLASISGCSFPESNGKLSNAMPTSACVHPRSSRTPRRRWLGRRADFCPPTVPGHDLAELPPHMMLCQDRGGSLPRDI